MQAHSFCSPTLVPMSEPVMITVALQFPSVQLLWQFRLAIAASKFTLHAASKTLVCCCTEDHISLAIARYQATVVSKKDIVFTKEI